MARMELVRGKLFAGERLLLDHVEGRLGSRIQATGQRTWHGFFESATERLKQVRNASPYRLVLDDGRTADVSLHILPGAVPGLSLVEFSVCGVLAGWKVGSPPAHPISEPLPGGWIERLADPAPPHSNGGSEPCSIPPPGSGCRNGHARVSFPVSGRELSDRPEERP